MTSFGFVLLLMGALLVVAEAHLPAAGLGIAGGMALIAGGIVVIVALGGGALVAVPVGVGLGALAAGWTLVMTRAAAGTRGLRVRGGAEGMCGRVGVVRRWNEPVGKVFLDGGLWRARHNWAGSGCEALREGDPVVVEHVSGLTLSVRRAEEWELLA